MAVWATVKLTLPIRELASVLPFSTPPERSEDPTLSGYPMAVSIAPGTRVYGRAKNLQANQQPRCGPPRKSRVFLLLLESLERPEAERMSCGAVGALMDQLLFNIRGRKTQEKALVGGS